MNNSHNDRINKNNKKQILVICHGRSPLEEDEESSHTLKMAVSKQVTDWIRRH